MENVPDIWAALPPSELEHLLLQLVSEYAPQFPKPESEQPAHPRVFCSDKGDISIRAKLSGGRGTIFGMPVEERAAGEAIFRSYMAKDGCDRRPVLCNVGTKGTGKSVQQQFNLLSFVQLKETGLAFEVTFYDDQPNVTFNLLQPGGVVDTVSFDRGVALRIIHRALSMHLPRKFALEILKVNAKAVLKALQPTTLSQNAIVTAISAARRLVCTRLPNVTPSTPVLVGVDELVQASTERKPLEELAFPPQLMMSHLISMADKPHNRHIHFSIAAYMCLQMHDVSTYSGRDIALQPLTPIFPAVLNGLSSVAMQQLPIAVRVFANEALHALLPPTQDALKTTAKVSELLRLSSGHPRRTASLLRQLGHFDESFLLAHPLVPTTVWGTAFLAALETWLDEQKMKFLISAMNGEEDYQIGLNVLLEDGNLDHLMVDVGRQFRFPLSRADAKDHATFVQTQAVGLCQFIGGDFSEPLLGHVFIPTPVLRAVREEDISEILSPADALSLLSTALDAFAVPCFALAGRPQSSGKPFERVVEASLLLHALANNIFKIGNICGRNDGLFNTFLLGGEDIKWITDIRAFPVDQAELPKPVWDLASLEMVAGLTHGCVFRPSLVNNPAGDVFMLLRRRRGPRRVLVVVQCKDWYNQHDMVREWRENQGSVRDVRVQSFLAKHHIDVVYMLFSVNPVVLTAGETIGPDECFVDLVRMRSWQPTTAYNAENAHRLRCICRAETLSP